jgi:hypothetical protein
MPVPLSPLGTYRDGRRYAMKATVGDRVLIHGRAVGMAARTGEVVEIRGEDEHALLVVRFDDGHESILLPGSDCEILHAT